MHRGEHLENQVVTGPQVRALMGQDRGDLVVGQGRQRALADDHATAHAGQAVGQRLGHVEDAQPAFLRLARTQVDDHAVMGPAAPGGDRDLHHGNGQPGADHQRQREDHDVGDPQRPAQYVDLSW